MRFLAFKIEIIESIITKNQLTELEIYEHPKLTWSWSWSYLELELLGVTWSWSWSILGVITTKEKKAIPQKRCAVCSKSNKRKESRYQCKNCSSYPSL